MADSDGRNSLQHILMDGPPPFTTPRPASRTEGLPVPASSPPASSVIADAPLSPHHDGDDEAGRDGEEPHYSALTQTTRRNANGSVSSVFSGNKIKHLKKDDGIPLWRKDIQYELLQAIFEDTKPVFTRQSDKAKNHTFADIYIDTLASSSKTSKILKEKLVQDQMSAITMAMVCLLVNVGRMNTTLNFFPEMRAQLRTYHSIPALQAQRDPHAYKQLQDAPRLKSILKGASEDEPQPGTMEEIMAAARPRTNAVNLIFVLAQYAPKVSELHFTPPHDFFDLIMRTTLSSKSRARAFLWLMWWYLESDFTAEEALHNPFGAGADGEGTEGLPIKLPALEVLTEEQAALENVDTPEERAYGESKRKERIAIVNSEPSPAMTALKRARKERTVFRPGYVPSEQDEGMTPSRDMDSPMPYGSMQHYYGSDGGSPSPPASIISGMPGRSNNTPLGPLLGGASTPSRATPMGKSKPLGRGALRRSKLDPSIQTEPNSPSSRRSIIPGHQVDAIMSRAGQLGADPNEKPTAGKKSRPLTAHQLKINEYRQQRILRIIGRGLQTAQVSARKKRVREGGVLRAWKRIRALPSGWDSEEEETRAAAADKADDEAKADDTEWWRLFGKRFRANLPRSTDGVFSAGYVLPVLKEVEDAGEMAGHHARVLATAARALDVDNGHTILLRRFVRRKSEVDVYAEELERDTWELGERPRLVRKNLAPVKETKKEEGEVKEEDMDLDDTAVGMAAGDLDEEDRELLGEVDAEDSEGDMDGDMDVDTTRVDGDVSMAEA